MKILDLFCGVGGASVGYHRAGFEVVGVDINPQPDYPFEFIQADAIDILKDVDLSGFHAIHTSPPCQAHSYISKGTNKGREYINLVPETRELLARAEKNYGVVTVIENVPGAGLRKDAVLCGEMFGLSVIRHRHFEMSFHPKRIAHKPHRGKVAGWRHGVIQSGPYVSVYGDGGYKGTVAEWQEAMDIVWTDNRKSIAEAIPPAYTEWLGKDILVHLSARR